MEWLILRGYFLFMVTPGLLISTDPLLTGSPLSLPESTPSLTHFPHLSPSYPSSYPSSSFSSPSPYPLHCSFNYLPLFLLGFFSPSLRDSIAFVRLVVNPFFL
jgi:hypothetical protein